MITTTKLDIRYDLSVAGLCLDLPLITAEERAELASLAKSHELNIANPAVSEAVRSALCAILKAEGFIRSQDRAIQSYRRMLKRWFPVIKEVHGVN